MRQASNAIADLKSEKILPILMTIVQKRKQQPTKMMVGVLRMAVMIKDRDGS